MIRRFYTKDFEELLTVADIPANYPVNGHVEEEKIDNLFLLSDRVVSGNVRHIKLNGISISYSDLILNTDMELAVEQDGPHLELHFELEGQKHFKNVMDRSHDISIQKGRHSLFFIPAMKGNLTFMQESSLKKEAGIVFSLERFLGFFDNDLSILGEFGTKLIKGEPAVFSEGMVNTPFMLVLLQEILNCELTGVLKKLYIEARVIELIGMAIEKVHPRLQRITGISKEDIEKIYYAREIVLERLDEPCSLLQLARMTGLNDFKLKRGFKEVFGTTVFGLLFEERMKMSRLLLIDGKHAITDIAYQAGYKNPTHFTVAFKRKFGYLPSDLKKGNFNFKG